MIHSQELDLNYWKKIESENVFLYKRLRSIFIHILHTLTKHIHEKRVNYVFKCLKYRKRSNSGPGPLVRVRLKGMRH